MSEATTPAAEEALAPDQAEVAEAEAPEIDETEGAEEGGDDQSLAEDDTEEIEHEGSRYRIPKALKGGFLMQADYTRKTQELAQHRQALDGDRQALAQQAEAQAQTIGQRAQLVSVNQALEQYANMNWQAYTAQFGSDATATAMAQWQQLQHAKGALEGDIARKEDDWRTESETRRSTALGQADQQLASEIQGYGPQVTSAVRDVAASFGFSPAEVLDAMVTGDGKPDVRAFKVLHELSQLRAYKAAAEAKNTKAQTAQKQAAVQPAKTVKANGGQFKPGLDDSLSDDEWLRRRNADIARKQKEGVAIR